MTYLSIILAIILVMLGSYYLYKKKQLRSLQSFLDASQTELTQSKTTLKQLSEENVSLKTQLQDTFEDPITNLVSWKLFENRLEQSLKESERYQLTLGIMVVDIDDFKLINDALSYEAGNIILQETASRIQDCIRQVDTVSRFNKDTFVILLAQLNKPETAVVVAQRILQAFKAPIQVLDNDSFISVGIGIAIYPTDGETVSNLLHNAEQALHLAKQKGKNTYQFYQGDMQQRSQRELVLHTSLSKEDIFDNLNIYYQPIMDVKNETISGMDGLLHWQHPQLGLVSPNEIYLYAEKLRKLNVISEWLLKTQCKQFLHWRSLGLTPQFIGMSLQIGQLDSQFIYRISQILQELSFKPDWLMLEIKESHAALSSDGMSKAFNMLKYIGIKIAIDNFGADSFALCYLKNTHIDYLKLDPILIADINENQKTIALIQSIMVMANHLSLEVIAQGVEAKEQMEILKGLGVSLMQGGLFGAPRSSQEVKDKMVMTSG